MYPERDSIKPKGEVMKKITLLTCISALAFSGSVFAQSANDESIKSDVNNINGDNAAIQQDQQKLNQDRAAKNADSANGSYGKETVDATKMGADKAAIAEKQTAKSINQKKLKHHKKKAATDNSDANTSTTPAN
jgi:hypothetical protein